MSYLSRLKPAHDHLCFALFRSRKAENGPVITRGSYSFATSVLIELRCIPDATPESKKTII